MKLYTNQFSRGRIIQWYLEELGLEYEAVEVDIRNPPSKPAELFEVNPTGKVPGLQDGDIRMFETGAILYYLAEKQGKLPASVKERTAILQWLFYSASEVSGILTNPAAHEKKFKDVLSLLEGQLGQREYLAGDAFSIADVLASSSLTYIPMVYKEADFSPYPKVVAWMQRLGKRPACARQMTAFGGPLKVAETA